MSGGPNVAANRIWPGKLTQPYIFGRLNVPQWDALKHSDGKMAVFQCFAGENDSAGWLSGLQPKQFTVLL